MTAATVDRLLDVALDLDQPTAIHAARYLATIVDVEVRRQEAGRLVEARRAELALYVDLVRERFGHSLALERVLADDEVLAELTILAIA